MAVPDTRRLALIQSRVDTADGAAEYLRGTGYFVTSDLVLTASHALADGAAEEIKVRVEQPSAGEERWREAHPEPVWIDLELDAALIRVRTPLSDVQEPPDWGSSLPDKDVKWASTAYPISSSREAKHGLEAKTAGLDGTLYAQGGGGQGIRELDLGVKFDPEKAESWQGISGAPVFVDDKFVGLIKSVPKDFGGNRIVGLPVDLVLRDPRFLAAIAPTPEWVRPFPEKTWCLLLRPDNGKKALRGQIVQSIRKNAKKIFQASGEALSEAPQDIEVRDVQVTDILHSPESWLQFLPAICAAPIMVFDVDGLQPAVMMLVGIRAVVRRGVTIMVTSEVFDEELLNKLPFNIKESKLLFSGYEIMDPRHPSNMVGRMIVEGLEQIRSNPNYLDLPSYEAVRCPKPNPSTGGPRIEDTVFMLCSFQPDYKSNWSYVAEVVVSYKPELIRMSDISSPRLVGQGLYERIRWTPCCVVDWTHWRPNVFFEFGVRLACSSIGPVSLIDADKLDCDATSSLEQRKQLIKLFRPAEYRTDDATGEPIEQALEHFDKILSGAALSHETDALTHDATYRMVIDAFDWTQEQITIAPHEELRATAEAQFGRDPQKTGVSPILFSSNAQFAKKIRSSVQERWIAAWFYLLHRNAMSMQDEEPCDPLSRFRDDDALRKELLELGEIVVQSLRDSADEGHKRLRGEVLDVIDELE